MKLNETVEATKPEGREALNLREVMPNGKPAKRMAIEPVEAPENDGAPDGTITSTNGTAKKSKRYLHLLAGVSGIAVAIAAGVYYERFIAPFESTDDAFIEGDATPVAPQVAGQVVQLMVKDNESVKAGDVMLQIDPREFQAKVDQARANLAAAKSRLEQANAQFSVDQAKVEQEKANVIAAQAESRYAAADFKRFQSIGVWGISESQLDLADTRARSSAAQVDAARNKESAAEAQSQLDKATIQTAAATVALNEAALRQAELDLSYTRVTAPVSGFVTHRTVDEGAYVQPGQNLLAVMPRQVWIVANFKETQLKHMRPGQLVEVKVDAYPQAKFTGHVDSIQAGTGARFSLLPPENATGNFVKVVQRVPVKIVLDSVPDSNFVLGAGMSVEPSVRVN